MLVKFCNLRAYGKFVMLSLAFFPRLFMASGLTVCRSCILFYVPMSAAPDAHVRILLANHGPRVRPGVGQGYRWEFQLMGVLSLKNSLRTRKLSQILSLQLFCLILKSRAVKAVVQVSN